jgi:dipeptidyl aminopeptidase/acylaminoacyl peptidase
MSMHKYFATLALLLVPFAVLADAPPTIRAVAAEADSALEARVAAMGRVGAALSPQFSPDGSEIAFVTTLSGLPQLWRMPAAGGYPRAVTAGDDPVSGAAWSPDGKLAFAVSPGGGYNAQIYIATPDGRARRRITAGGQENNFSGDFADDGRYFFRSNLRDAASTDAWIFDPERGESRLALEFEGLGGIVDLLGDKALVYRLVTRGNTNLWLDDLATGASTLLTPHEGPASVSGRFSADGRSVFIAHNLDRDNTVFARIDIDDAGQPSKPHTLAERDGVELDGFELDTARRQALLRWNVAGRNELELFDLETGEHRLLPPPPAELAAGVDFAPDGRSVVLMISGSASPWEIWRLELASGEYRRLSYSPHVGVELDRMVRPELRRFVAHDGLELTGWLYLPPGFEAPGPVVLSFHGGPEGQERPAFRADYQALLDSGIAVFAPNIRGSAGFGRAFLQLDNHEKRFDANRDIRSAADWLLEAGIGAPGRLGIMGGSYGGYAVMVGVTEFPDTFAAGANLYGIVNFETFFSHSTPWMGAISTGEYGDPKTQRQLLRDLSPIHKLDRVKAAMLVMHGANDTNVPLVEAEQVVSTLEQRGLDVTYVLFPDEGHGWRKESNRVHSTVELVGFFRQHLLTED